MYSVMKADLVIWTLNGEATITRCPDSIEMAVPASVICHRYLIEAVRSVGGFPEDFPMSTDGALRNNLFQKGWRWKVCNDVISRHYRDSFVGQMRHSVLQTAVGKVLWETYPEYPASSKFGRLLATPITGRGWLLRLTVRACSSVILCSAW